VATTSSLVRERPAVRHRPATGLRILVVEDNADNRESLVLLLRQLGHEAGGAEDGPRALSLLASGAYDLAFIDIGLPGTNGYDIARHARANGGQNVHLVALTGYGQPEDRERSRAAGFDGSASSVDKAVAGSRAIRPTAVRSRDRSTT
jgi:CheY-like chemotaxis protein